MNLSKLPVGSEVEIKVVKSGLGRFTAWCEGVDGSMSFGDVEREAVDKARAEAKRQGYKIKERVQQ